MAVSVATFTYALKRLFPPERVMSLMYQDRPGLALIPKSGNFYGEDLAVPVQFADVQGRSSDFTVAQTRGQATQNEGRRFLLVRRSDRSLYTLDTEVILASRSNMGAFLEALNTEVESAFNTLANSLSKQLYRDGTGDRGQVAAIAANVVTLANTNDIVNFEVGQSVRFSTGAPKTTALRTGAGVITAVNRDTGQFTMASTPAGTAANDFIFFEGDRQDALIGAQAEWRLMSGMDAWLPAAPPGAGDSFFGVNRSVDTTRLAGIRQDISTFTPEEGYVVAFNRMARDGASPDTLLTNFLDVRNLHLSLASKAEVVYSEVGTIGFEAIRIRGPKGPVLVYADRDCPAGLAYGLTRKTWKLYHLGELMNHLNLDGATLAREAAADRFEGRINYYGNLGCRAPGYNSRIITPA